jgi:hypothetical protein
MSATGQFLLATYRQFSRPPTGSFSCPLTHIKNLSLTSVRCAVNGFPIHPMMWGVAADECQIGDEGEAQRLVNLVLEAPA